MELCLDVDGLVVDGHLGHTRQVHQRQVEHVRRTDAQLDGLGGDALRFAELARRLRLNLGADVAEVVEALAFEVAELTVRVPLRIAPLAIHVHQLQQQRTARDDPRPARQEVAADEALEHGGFAAALRADDDDLGQ